MVMTVMIVHLVSTILQMMDDDYDVDGMCDLGDEDDDNDSALDDVDSDDNNPEICSD